MGILFPTTAKNIEWHRSVYDPIISTNRTTGVAPLSVSFDLIAESTFANDTVPMLSEFIWDFGDGSDPYNVGKGYCPAHVYKEVGTYLVTMSAYLEGILKCTRQETVTVEAFSGTTYYISADGSDSNDGLTKETPFATPSYAISNFLDTNTRFLLRQGDTFTQSSGITVGEHGGAEILGPVIIGSYEDSLNPSSVKPILYDTRNATASVAIIAFLNCTDFRLVNLKLQATGGDVATRDLVATYPSGFTQSSVTPSSTFLLLDCDTQGVGSTAFHVEGDYHVVQDCTVRDGGSYGVFVTEGIHCAFIGMSMKDFSNDRPEYTMRLSTHIVGNYVAYCDLWGDYTKSTFQIRGDDSSYNYVWNNQFDRFVGINQTNNEEDETLHHNTFDANITVMRDYEGNTYGSYNNTGFFFSSNDSMCRNNIVYGFDYGFQINTHTIVGGCKRLWYHNNTVIANRPNACFIGINKDAESVDLKNNIFINSALTTTASDHFINVITADPVLATDLTQINSDYNSFFGEAWGDVSTYTIANIAYYSPDPTLASWRSLYNNDINSQWVDALLNTTMNVADVSSSLLSGFAEVGSTSSVIDEGDSKIYTLFDFYGSTRVDKTIGAIRNTN